jgi:hypothetical protein
MLYFLSLDVNKDYKEFCYRCHGDAKVFYSGKLKTKDLRGSIKGMYLAVGEKADKTRIDNMLKFAKGFKK